MLEGHSRALAGHGASMLLTAGGVGGVPDVTFETSPENLTSLNIGYFTVNRDIGEGMVDWGWLAEQPAAEETGLVRHLQFKDPVLVTMNGTIQKGIIRKPGGSY